MDELDLVRLARPAVDEPSPDALAAMKAAALDAPAALPGDGDGPDAPIELDVTTPVTPIRRRRGLVLTSIAAAVLTVGGGIAIASRDRSPDRTAGSADTSVAGDTRPTAGDAGTAVDDSAKQVDGTWFIVGARLDGEDRVFDVDRGRYRLVLDSTTGGYSLTVCDVLVGTGIHVVGALLQLDGSLTGVEGGCTDTATRELQNRLVAVLKELPTVQTDGDNLTLTNDQGTITMVRAQPVLNAPGPNPLDGRTFRVTSLRDGDTTIPVESSSTIGFVDGRVTAHLGCNGMSGTVQSAGTTLVVIEVMSTLRGCGEDENRRDMVVGRLLESRPSMELTDGRLRLSAGGVTLAAEEIEGPPPTASPATTAAPARNLLEGHTYRLTSLRDGDVDVPVTATNVLVFTDGRVRAKVGCNDMSGAVASAADDVLVVPQIESSAVDCDPDESAREAAVFRLLTSRPTMRLDERGLQLSSGDLVLTATDVSGPRVLAPVTMDALAGRTFRGTFQDAPVTLRVIDAERFVFNAGCNDLQGRATIVDGRLDLTEVAQTEKACDERSTTRDAALSLVVMNHPLIGLDGTTLVITADQGTGMQLVAAS